MTRKWSIAAVAHFKAEELQNRTAPQVSEPVSASADYKAEIPNATSRLLVQTSPGFRM
jgi:hypothetical protein